MSYRLIRLFLFLMLTANLSAQADDYAKQVSAIEELLEEGKFRIAEAQSLALISSGKGAQLPLIEAAGRFFWGRCLTENELASAKDRVNGIQELKAAAQLFRKYKDGERVAEILGLLEKLTGSQSIESGELPSVRKLRKNLPSEDSINEVSLTAIVSLQDQAITALNDSQVRQLLTLRNQERELDELAFRSLNDSLLLIQQESIIERQQAEVSQEKLRRNFLLALAGGILLVLASLYLRYLTGKRYQEKLEEQNHVIAMERKRSDELLLNILPASVAEELKLYGKARAKRFDSATVLFADFKGFSTLASRHEPEALISMLDEAFRAFDKIIRVHRLEKIKTIGDCYMCAGGLPEADNDHAERMVRAALAMQVYLEKNPNFKARIGIHTGPVVAGVVGQDKFVYDIWGDTVNQAARLEVAGEVGRVAISRTTKDLLGQEFSTESAGTFEAKNIGKMERFWVTTSPLSPAD